MNTVLAAKPPVLVAFTCPQCRGAQNVHLVTLSRQGSHTCTACGRRLTPTDVSRAIAHPRTK